MQRPPTVSSVMITRARGSAGWMPRLASAEAAVAATPCSSCGAARRLSAAVLLFGRRRSVGGVIEPEQQQAVGGQAVVGTAAQRLRPHLDLAAEMLVRLLHRMQGAGIELGEALLAV